MRASRLSVIAVLLFASLVATLPGIADVVEAASSDGDCVEPCPGDASDGDCSSSCDECPCCPRAMTAVLTQPVVPEVLEKIEADAGIKTERRALVLPTTVFHPPRS